MTPAQLNGLLVAASGAIVLASFCSYRQHFPEPWFGWVGVVGAAMFLTGLGIVTVGWI